MECRVTVATEFTAVSATAVAFSLTSRAEGAIEGTAVVCLDARYSAVKWHGAARLLGGRA